MKRLGELRKRMRATLTVAALAAAVTTGALAHHSVAGQFDMSQPVTWTGVISKVDWINPHIYVHLDVPDDSGVVTTWELETVPPGMMRRAGLTSTHLIGDGSPVEIEGLRARDGTEHLGYILKITYADGRYYQLSQR
jgi:hypothetical protein